MYRESPERLPYPPPSVSDGGGLGGRSTMRLLDRPGKRRPARCDRSALEPTFLLSENPHVPTHVLAMCSQDSAVWTSGRALGTAEPVPAARQAAQRHGRPLAAVTNARYFALTHERCEIATLARAFSPECSALGRDDVGPRRTPRGASARSVAGGTAAHEAACGGPELGIFRASHRGATRAWGRMRV